MRTPTRRGQWFFLHLLTFSPLSLYSVCPCSSRPLVKRRPGRAGSRSTPSRLIRASLKWSRAHLTSTNPTDTVASTSRRAASRRSRAKGKIITRPAGMTLDHPTPTSVVSHSSSYRFRFVLAVVDSGACVSLMGVSIFYRRCPATSLYLASYPATPSGAEPTALVPVSGTCVAHSKTQGGTPPRMHCNAEGEWMVPVGGCVCDEGHEPNLNGSACLGKPDQNQTSLIVA